MKVCGLTGGVGMGKSTAAGLLFAAGVRVIDTDDLARTLVQPGQPALAEIATTFGPHLLAADGSLQRAELARLVFASAEARKQLEAILHPRIRAGWSAQLATWRAENCPLAVVVIPLLFETGAETQFEKIICAACSPMTQLARLRARGWPAEQLAQRIAAQWLVAEKMARSHFVLWTEGSLAMHRRQLAAIREKL